MEFNYFIIFLLVVLSLFLVFKLCGKPNGIGDWILNLLASAATFMLFFAIYGVYLQYRGYENEIEYCREKIENGSLGWHILIVDKYSQEEEELNGRLVFTERHYYITYRYNEIGDEHYTTRTERVNSDIYNYYKLRKVYVNNRNSIYRDTYKEKKDKK